MNTSITKVASLDIISDAMEDLYKNNLVKKAQENFYSSAVAKLQQFANQGHTAAETILDALRGEGSKDFPIDVKNPVLGLSEEEAWAIVQPLKDKGFNVDMEKAQEFTSKQELGEALRSYQGETPESLAFKDDNPYYNTEEDEKMANSFPSTGFPVNTKGEKPTSGEFYPIEGPTEPGVDFESLKESIPMTPEERKDREEELKALRSTSSKMLDAIEKIANILDDAGFEKSAEVADELIEKIAYESYDLEDESVEVLPESDYSIAKKTPEDFLEMAEKKYEKAVEDFGEDSIEACFYKNTIESLQDQLL